MDLASEIAKTEKELIAYKTGQSTSGDSANFYTVEYKPGWFVIPEGTTKWREHTVKCVPYNNTDKAIFMPMIPSSSFSIQGAVIEGKLLTIGQDLITWYQAGEYASNLANAGYASGVPKGFMIYSNVDFYIETSYVEKSI